MLSWEIAFALLVLGSVGALVVGAWNDRRGFTLGTVAGLAACAAGAAGGLQDVLQARAAAELHLAWAVPIGSLRLGVDALSAFFLLCIFLVSGLGLLFGWGYLQGHAGGRRLSPAAAWLNLLIAAMALVVTARDGILFLIGWEAMFLASYLLVTRDDHRRAVRHAGTVYLIASHAGVLCLFIAFALMARWSGGPHFDFATLSQAVPPSAGAATAVFLLGAAGFGLKAGLWPLHVWLPRAHPAAPSHVSAVMSGAMIKLGVYGILRLVLLLGAPAPWWGVLLVIAGAVAGLMGILGALAQRELKRLLAYSSVENAGLITMGVGLGLLGQSTQQPALTFLGYGAALLHTLNHGLFKTLLFSCAGSVQIRTGTTDLNALGGLLRRLPFAGSCFAIGAVAICGLPPLGGFVSEWLLYLGAFQAAGSGAFGALAGWLALPAVALIGGLALATFAKAFGLAFLGQPRLPGIGAAHRAPAARNRNDAAPAAPDSDHAAETLGMKCALAAAAAGCALLGLWPAGALRLVGRPLAQLSGQAGPGPDLGPSFGAFIILSAILIGLTALLLFARRRLLTGRPVGSGPTWACGYEAPSPRMQYTALSFSEPLQSLFAPLSGRRPPPPVPQGYFPDPVRHRIRLEDPAEKRLLGPAVQGAFDALKRVRVLQSGFTPLYLTYIVAALVIVLAWQFA